ncbi:AMP-binding protein [Zoogloeaceae bacterium G21618-S1]|nr:AMP-binding protein [Zoogloeaceae bacterium G21618-S1]
MEHAPTGHAADDAPGPANYVPLSPVSLLHRAADIYPSKIAVIDGERRFSYTEFRARCCRLASALVARGIGRGDTVAVLAPNTSAMLEAHFGVLMAGAVLNAINIRLDAPTIAYCLRHGKARILLADTEFAALTRAALAQLDAPPPVVDIHAEGFDAHISDTTYEALLSGADPAFRGPGAQDEWQTVSLLYTSGTTGNPKGVLYHSRGAYLNALSNALITGLTPECVYLWTLPMFHCNGWTYPWAVTAVGGTHVCLRKIDAGAIFELIERERVTHLHGAPVVLNLLIHAPAEQKRPITHRVDIGVGGAPPPSRVIADMERLGVHVTHLYGTTETYGPSAICAWQTDWHTQPADAQARLRARQGVRMLAQEDIQVVDTLSGQPVPADGETLGEVLLRGNAVMKGYLDNRDATATALADGFYHTGDLAVRHADGYFEIRDRAKDIIISGGENIASIEVEEALYQHPDILEAAVVAAPDARWGEVPCAFITLREGATLSPEAIQQFCRERLAHFKSPRHILFGPLTKTATGKVQKFALRAQARAHVDATTGVPS